MHFTALTIASLLSAAQAVQVHVVAVGKNPANQQTGLKYFPEKVTAQPGDMVQFQFWAGNHTVSQSSFDKPCEDLSGGIFSGFQPVAAGEASGKAPVFTVMVNDTKPIWIFCDQGKHCQNGMSMVINENTGANPTKSLENYQKMAAALEGGMGGNNNNNTYPSGNNSTMSTAAPPVTKPTSTGQVPAASSSGLVSLASSSFEASTTMLLLIGAGFMLL